MASGCLQAVITQLPLLTQPKFPGQRGAKKTKPLKARVFCIRQEIAVTVAQIPYSYFMNMWTLIMLPVCTLTLIPFNSHPPPHLYRFTVCVPLGVTVKRKLLKCSPLAWVLKYTSRVHSVNQKWKAIRWEIEYVPLHDSSADYRGSYGDCWIGDTLPPAGTQEELPFICFSPAGASL